MDANLLEASWCESAAPLAAEELRRMDALWRAANYLSVGQIYLLDDPLLRAPLTRAHIKPRLLGIGARRRAQLRLHPSESAINNHDST